jgi:C-terminal processing protease CtpA/Prc
MKIKRLFLSPWVISVLLHILPILMYLLAYILHLLMFSSPKNGSQQYPVTEIFTEKGAGAYCKRYYGGIGIKYEGATNTIKEIAPGYVAERIGLQVGDVIVWGDSSIRGAVGRHITITYLRKGVLYKKKVVTEKICLD